MFNPISTYRIQFHSGFTFKNFQAAIPYLHNLGIKTIYASPIFLAAPGSMHGYDGLDPHHINPEIGTMQELKKITAQLKKLGMFWIQDIVPNHMGFHHQNKWLMDVLEKGERSSYRRYFDIISEDLEKEPLMVPFLGDSLDEVIAAGELKLVKNGTAWFLKYHDSEWPIKKNTDVKLSLSDVAAQQFYRLCSYKESNERINYRRFFTVNNLICLNIQDDVVFQDYHRLIKELIDSNIFQGLRIDHVDGLYDPGAYLQQLRNLCGPDTYIVVEKILEQEESLPAEWPIAGTTGYDYLGMVNQLFTNGQAVGQFNKFYHTLNELNVPVDLQIRKKKRDFLLAFMQGELDNLYHLFCQVNTERGARNATMDQGVFKTVIAEIMVHCPVYRYYGNQAPLKESEQQDLKNILNSIALSPEYENAVHELEEVLLGEDVRFYQRLMQFTGPLMAKGVEDTLMYTYNRFIGNNEVGDSPDVFGMSVRDFHNAIRHRQKHWPMAMNATATHDTKRAEDARTRLNALTHLNEEWLRTVEEWRELNQSLKTNNVPDANDEYFIYQTLVAGFPEEEEEIHSYSTRLQEYLQKALRESKRNSEWENPDQEYEAATKTFINGLLDPHGDFQAVFRSFQEKVTSIGHTLSLSSLILKMCIPGVPDVYQGTELWDLSMVDPDNRRAVDYRKREAYLNGKLPMPDKLGLMYKLLQMRNADPLLFSEGLYLPLEVTGKYAAKLIAFARKHGRNWLVVAVPVSPIDTDLILTLDWGDTRVLLPNEELKLCDLCPDQGFLLHQFQEEEKSRGAGLLLHISSLPSKFGIGDFGPAADQFLMQLASSGQRFWQLLPMNPLTETQSFSPYSATSIMAGNTLFISPEELCTLGLLEEKDLKKRSIKSGRKVRYQQAKQLKDGLLTKAFQNYKATLSPALVQDFAIFCDREKDWLDDYALYEAIKSAENGREWFEWSDGYKYREKKTLHQFSKDKIKLLEEIKWLQFIFFKQWKALREKADILGIQLIGDLPFYTALDSADVWANPQLFKISAAGKVKGVAGVPPDYFNEEGQLWGMPVYDWQAMENQGFQWWVSRIAKNLEMYDMIRLDHFRAFSAYWEVPSDSGTAKNGSWIAGPGERFFEVMKQHFKQLPFIAEDLGEIDEEVYALRDKYELPGMRVLQFAFGDDIADSIHIPHNFSSNNSVVYTGTHDNNTLLGWYQEEAAEDTKKRLEKYHGFKITQGNILDAMLRLAYSSTAKLAIIPMQDLLAKGAAARMNTPASVTGNWLWRMKSGEADVLQKNKLKELLKLFGR